VEKRGTIRTYEQLYDKGDRVGKGGTSRTYKQAHDKGNNVGKGGAQVEISASIQENAEISTSMIRFIKNLS